MLTPTALNALIRKVNDQEITNSKDVRKLRQILRDPVARDEFLADGGSIDSANLKVGPLPTKKRQGLAADIQALSDAIRSYPWTTLVGLKGDAEAVRAVQDAEKLIKELKKALRG